MTLPVIKSFLAVATLALTPTQRWNAAGKFNSNFMAERWFILIVVVAIVILTVLLAVISFNRIRQERKAAEKLFFEYADKRGLTARERQILLSIANKAGLKRNESIFTLASAFDRGAIKMKRNFADRQKSENAGQLRMELSFLREKLGFKKQRNLSNTVQTNVKRMNSLQIPIGKKINLICRKAHDLVNVESIVVRNSEVELAVRPTKPVEIVFGESWCVRYCFGSSVWEFDTSVVSYDGDILVLNHSDDVRFINRRRFIRVPVKNPAFIALFPFAKASEPVWGPPEFVSAVVTELAGPGLRVEAPLKTKKGDRVLLGFKLDNKDLKNKNSSSRIVEDIGKVTNIRPIKNGFSIAIELIGLSDLDVDELIRNTNTASVKAATGYENAPALASAEERAG
ncbi:MAG: hypothetical protein ACYSSL_04615 [Planctomycetota bacterium]|jgi:hypothetical protein